MFAKPFNLLLTYIVTIFNIIILILPIFIIAAPFVEFENSSIIVSKGVKNRVLFATMFMIFLVSFFMLCYLVLDFIFGFSFRSSLKNCKPFQKIKDYEFLSEVFNQVKDKFSEQGVKLYIKDSSEINAFALSSFGRRAIILTHGLIDHYLYESPDPKKFLYSIRSIMGHEMSHLINKDFLPTFLVITNQKITNLISKILFMTINLLVNLVNLMPFGPRRTVGLAVRIYGFMNFIITAFNRFVVYNIYKFLKQFISRRIEYRCDYQSAKAFGGANMSRALSMLGDDGYFTLFSSHPRTKKRMKKVENIEMSERTIRPNFFDSLSNYFSILFLMFFCLFFAKQAKIDIIMRNYIENHEVIYAKLTTLWHLISKFF
jgi:Zn-dependent protease with chaperone function